MSHIKGKDAFLLIDGGSGYVPFVCAVSFSLKTSTETKEVMTVGDGNWSKPKAQKKSYTITFEGVQPIDIDDPAGYHAFDFIENQAQDVNFQYKIWYTSDGSSVVKMITGEALVIDSDLSSGADGFMDSSFTCAGFGAYERFNSNVACNATLSTVTYSAQGLLFVDINYTGLTGSDTIVYSVDGSTRRTLAGMSTNGTITITNGVGMNPGLHSIEVWPVCANGEEGTSLTTNYTKT
jgi:hypothetical protein